LQYCNSGQKKDNNAAQVNAQRQPNQKIRVTLAGLAQFIIPVPPIEEQQEIVRGIEAAFGKIETLVAETLRAAQLLDRLDQATLAKAFRGELFEKAS
jgi:restriction endonuclease S subunit